MKIIEVLRSLESDTLYKNREDFDKKLKEAFKEAGLNNWCTCIKSNLSWPF